MNSSSKINLYKELYQKDNNYLRNLIPMYKTINSSINFELNTFLDYGCGKSNLSEIFESKNKIKIFKYDPALEQYSKLDHSLKVDLIANCDVMEHIPENEIDSVLEEMAKLSDRVFFNIYLKEAETYLPNGENAHCTVKPIIWWKKKINKYFKNLVIIPTTYKNSVTIITWKISWFQHIKINFNNLNIFFSYILWLFRIKILNKNN